MSPRLTAAVAAIGLLGATTWFLFWDPTPSYQAVANDGASLTGRSDLEEFSDRRVFFGHMSVGKNILAGLDEIRALHGVPPTTEIEIEPGDAPALPSGGVLVHALIGENRHPFGKLTNFDTMLRGGLAEQIDTAALKFCYIDVRWNTDVEALFETYRTTLTELEADYPEVRFIHMTVPLTTGPFGIRDRLKVLVGRDDNAARERYNDLMRQAYGPDRLFDVATLEATAPDGTIAERELFEGYSSDGAHLNAAGSARMAAAFIGFVADERR